LLPTEENRLREGRLFFQGVTRLLERSATKGVCVDVQNAGKKLYCIKSEQT